jgi:hypothetical protein
VGDTVVGDNVPQELGDGEAAITLWVVVFGIFRVFRVGIQVQCSR